MAITTTGLAIQRVPFSETSQVVTFLTRDLGRVVSMVKGAFRAKNNFQGNIDLMELSRLTFTQPRGGSMLLLRQRVLLERFPSVHADLGVFACASLMSELLRLGIQEGQRTPGVYSLTVEVLEALEAGRLEPVRAAFLFQGVYLKKLGFEPVLNHCVECRSKPGPGSLLAVFPRQGGIICRNCRVSERDSLRISWETSRIIVDCVDGRLESIAALDLAEPIVRELWAFFELFLQYYLEIRINSFSFIKQLNYYGD